ncbi:MAG: DUF4352 domain-containing protein [Bacilli bacterium]|nr:DUF4352 domain-containing protein [Bacilli bacterium]
MIVRKPYAFLIKNFRKIHIFLLVLSLFVAYKLVNVNSFVNEFMRLGVYDSYADPITKHITSTLLLFTFLIAVGCGALILLLRYKKKPWKLYLVPFIEYTAMFFVLNIIRNFFLKATYDVATTDLRFSRDLLLIFLIAQLPAIAIFVMRTLGMDLQKFHFNLDDEYLELNEDDREEIEINIDVDTNSFKRFFKRMWRNLEYFYNEHKLICLGVLAIVGMVFVYNSYKYIFVTNRIYKQGEIYSVNGYNMKINATYFTDKSYNGEIISKSSNFIIVDLEITNNSAPRKIDMNKFHLKSGTEDYTTTEKMYANEFQDLGNCYDRVRELKRDETVRAIVVYKVKAKHKKNSFTLFYQEDKVLRRIRLNVKDISKIKDSKKLELGDDLTFSLKNDEKSFSLDSYGFDKTMDYTVRSCNTTKCFTKSDKYSANDGYLILKIDFASSDFEGKDMIDFSTKYGKIIYKNSEAEDEEIEFKYPFNRVATGKYIYTLVPDDMDESESIEIDYVIRNKRYKYKLK